MHELSISSAIVDTAVAHASGRRVSVVSVRIGHLRQAIPRSLHFYFGICTRETVAEGATLELEVVPGRLRCRECHHNWDVEVPAFRCPRCDSGDVAVLAGEELEVESIQVEEAACIV
ncbi:MAG: hydrogenase nickel incorporation protein HypA/HybF [Solirubrobacteraceae bacterium]|jgi:hydrogenase nickel incorporation protein HypA/HybF|nr:hydrogenase nickel incorporation protein HypA/HybF [Solirubrobacteraceae bacterium]